MSEPDSSPVGAGEQAPAAFIGADLVCPFGPSFFLGHLGRFVRDRCPDPQEQLPIVHVRLADGETLDVCHIIGVSPRWVMLAVGDPGNHWDGMAVEIVPFDIIRRVGIAIRRTATASIGFAQTQPPEIIAPETLVRAAMAPDSRRPG